MHTGALAFGAVSLFCTPKLGLLQAAFKRPGSFF